VAAWLSSLWKKEAMFGLFHLVMFPCRVAKMHKDRNDYISFLFLIFMEKNCGGGLELGGMSHCCDWQLGDCILLDSDQFAHGTQFYEVLSGIE
jgi:hypothetical protein